MIKRMISACLVICMLFALMPVQVYAESEVTYGYVNVTIWNEQPMKTKPYVALLKNDVIYMSIENLAEITGYEVKKGDFINFSKKGKKDDGVTVDVTYDGIAYFQNKEKKIDYIENEGDIFLPLAEMLYLLHAQWSVEDNVLVVHQFGPSIGDFLYEYANDISLNRVNQTDLLINGESRIAHVLRTSLAAMFNDFNIFDHISWDISSPNADITVDVKEKENGDKEYSIEQAPRAASEFVAKQYKEAMLQLAVDDKEFLTEEDQTSISSVVEKSGYQQVTSAWKDLTLTSGFPEGAAETVEAIQKLQGTKASLLFNKFGDVSALKDMPTKEFNEFAKTVDYFINVADTCVKFAEICNRSKEWDENFTSQISVLTDFDNEGYNTNVTDYIKVVAKELIKEEYNPSVAAYKQEMQDMLDVGASIVMNATPLGFLFSTPNIVMAVAKTNDELRNSVDAAELSYMVNCLIKIEQVAQNELSRIRTEFYELAREKDENPFDEKDLSRLRNATMLTLRSNLRNRSFIYYLNLRLNDDPQWEHSVDAQNIREQIRKDYMFICELMETEKYDEQLLRRDVEKPFNMGMTLTPEDMNKRGDVRQQFGVEIFREGEIPKNDDYVEIYTQFIQNEEYRLYNWDLEPFEYAMIDIDKNGIDELIINSKDDGNGFSQVQLYLYDVSTEKIQCIADFWACYGIRYSENYKALVYYATRPAASSSSLEYYTLNEDNLELILTIGNTIDESGNPACYKSENGQLKYISEEEKEEYSSKLKEISFIKLGNSEKEETVDIEGEIQKIRDIYYGIQNNLDSFEVQDGGANTKRYIDADGNIRKISAYKGAYYDDGLSDEYAAEYYYEIDNGSYRVRFVYVFGNGEEYRFYLNKNGECIRYIGADGKVQDFESPVSISEELSKCYQFCTYASLEIAWAMGG